MKMPPPGLLALGLLALSSSVIGSPSSPPPSRPVHTTTDPGLLPPGGGVGGGGGGGGSSSPASPSMTFFDRNTSSKSIELDLSNGVIEYINVPQNKITIQKGGSSHAFTIDQVMLQEANGNAALAASNKLTLLAELKDPTFQSRFSSIANHNASSSLLGKSTPIAGLGESQNPVSPGLRVYGVSHGLAAYNVSFTKSIYSQTPSLLPANDGGNPFYCDDDFICSEADLSWGDGGYMDFYYYDAPGSSPVNTSDYQYFQRWRKDQCSAASDDETDSLEAVGLMVIACASVETGVGALACAAAGGGVVKTMNRGADDSRHCLETYPGPGNWE